MPTRERAVDRGREQARRTISDLGREIREARRSHGLSLAEVGRAADLSTAAVSRIERGMVGAVPLVRLAELLAVVGLDLSARAYPLGEPIRDAAHAQLLQRFRARLATSLRWLTEVPVGGPGDARAWDAAIRGHDFLIGVEAETRLRDLQAIDRRIALKRRDGRVDHAILLLANTRWNRGVVREFETHVKVNFPVPGPRAIASLAQGLDPGGSSLILS